VSLADADLSRSAGRPCRSSPAAGAPWPGQEVRPRRSVMKSPLAPMTPGRR
jgi:hypothetical protein